MAMIPVWIAVASLFFPVSMVISLIIASLYRKGRYFPYSIGNLFALRYIARTMVTAIPVMIMTASLIGSLSVGDSLLEMVDENTRENLSNVDITIEIPSYINSKLFQDAELEEVEGIDASSQIIHLQGSARSGDRRLSSITVLGISKDAYDLLPYPGSSLDLPSRHQAFINRKASENLGIKDQGTFILSLDPFRGSENNYLGSNSEAEYRLNLTVSSTLENRGIGRYREDAKGEAPAMVILDLQYLQERIDMEGMVNKVLISLKDPDDSDGIQEKIKDAVDEVSGIDDAKMSLYGGSHSDLYFVHSEDLFFDQGPFGSVQGASPTLSYFVDGIEHSGMDVPYSVISGLDRDVPFLEDMDLGPGEIALTNWTIERIDADIGDPIELHFRILDDLGIPREMSRNFTLRYILDLDGALLEQGFLPSIPGLTDSPTCGDWDPGFDIDLDDLDDDDRSYWETYRTAPKGYIALEDARAIWSNAYGDTTALVIGDNGSQDLDQAVSTETLGISIKNVRESALGSSSALLIFPAMFLTFGTMILIAALLMLHASIKDLAERRTHEWGILRSTGIKRSGIRIAALGEAVPGILIGIISGIFAGILLGYLMNVGLGSAWSATVEGASVPFHLTPSSIMISAGMGSIASILLVLFSTWKATKDVVASSIKEKDPGIAEITRRRRWIWTILGISGAAAGLFVLMIGTNSDASSRAAYFTLGSMMAGVSISMIIFSISARQLHLGDRSLIITSNISRRPGKHPIAIVMLSMGLTLALSLTATAEILEDSALSNVEGYGGGYDAVIETSIPYKGDTEVQDLEIAVFLSLGDEGGTCSNLNAVYPPRILGAPREVIEGSGFGLVEHQNRFGSGQETWQGLRGIIDGSIPILVDQNTLQWIYYGSLGDEFKITSEKGQEVSMIVIGVLEPSVLTGSFVMSRDNLRDLFPSASETTYILASGSEDPQELSSIFEDFSPDVTLVKDLARENINSELSYLYLFRDFLVLGLLLSLASSAVFIHIRALSLRRELYIMRCIGASSRRTIGYFILENLSIFIIASLGSLIGSMISILLYLESISSGAPPWRTIVPMLIVVFAFISVSLITSTASSFWAIKGHRSDPLRHL